jgi:hypothetical protein
MHSEHTGKGHTLVSGYKRDNTRGADSQIWESRLPLYSIQRVSMLTVTGTCGNNAYLGFRRDLVTWYQPQSL